jgi:hypothetical protein
LTLADERFLEAIADQRRVCCCICPIATTPHRKVCQLFVEAGEVVVLERVGEHRSARCVPCATALRYRPCPACGAEPGQPCHTVGGSSSRVLAEPHAARARARTTAG